MPTVSLINSNVQPFCLMGKSFKMGNVQFAIASAEKSLEISSKINNKKLKGAVCSFLGKAYRSMQKENTAKHQGHHGIDDNIIKAEQYLRKALDCFDFLFENLQRQDDFKVSIFEQFTDTYKCLTGLLIETERPKEALLASDSGRARALTDSLVFQYRTIQEEHPSTKILTYSDVEAILVNDCFLLLHYCLLENCLAVWALTKDSIVLEKVTGRQFDSDIITMAGEEKAIRGGNSKRLLLADAVSKAYEEMEIKGNVTCENRSLDDYLADDAAL